MSIKPILFNTEMVWALLDGKKTVTRRVAKNINPNICCQCEEKFDHDFIRDDFIEDSKFTGYVCRKCGYGVSPPHSKYPVGTSYIKPPYQIGDILYVRETWGTYTPDPDKCYPTLHFKASEVDPPKGMKWRPSIHMPKEVARIFLRVTDVRVERLQDIDDDSVAAEGLNVGEPFDELWNKTIKPKDRNQYGWDANPWVWVISFEQISDDEYEAYIGGGNKGAK